MRKKTGIIIVFLVAASIMIACLLGLLVYQLPPVRERVGWRVDNLSSRIRRLLNPPEEVVFVPGANQPGSEGTRGAGPLERPTPQVTTITRPTDLPRTEQPMAGEPTAALQIQASPTPSPTALPRSVLLPGILHEYQQFNNCGPANLAMALSYWGWQGDQRDTRAFLRPNLKVDDKNVMPSEMVAFVEQFTGFQALTRTGGDQELLRSLIAAGYPVLIEAGHHPPDDWWMGHYLVVSGYDDDQQIFTVQDSLANPDLQMSYQDLASHWWRDFNYVYVVIFPPEKQAEVAVILGERLDETSSFASAAQKAMDEIPVLQGRDQFFAWFNLGSSRVGLQDYEGAAQAFDKAFEVYQSLSEDLRPYRLMWYQESPYLAYYHTARYQDVVNLANTTFAWVGQPVLEESYYWRGRAYLALGQQSQAVSDLQKAAELNPNYAPPHQELSALGVALP